MEMIDPNGQRFTYAYDELNRQIDSYYPDAVSPFNKIVRIHKLYDPNNNVTEITEIKTGPDNSTIIDTTVNRYDSFDRLDDSTQRGLTIDYTYDANGNRIRVSTPSGTTTYTFDSRNRIKTATADGLVTAYTYSPDGKKDIITYPNATEVKYTYHPSNRIETVTHRTGPSVISSYSYDYDKNGNRISQTELQDGLTERTTYQYDTIDRLKDFSLTDGTNVTVTEYAFDGYNRKTERVRENGILTKSKTYSYDETNWLTRLDYTDNSQSESRNGSINYKYDNNGNTIRKVDSSLPDEGTKFVYDSRNQLVQVTRGPPANELILGQYDYNSSGLRIRHRQSERGDVDYYYDDDAVIEEHNAADGSLLAHYRYADRLLSLATRDPQPAIQYYHHDALGSTVNLTAPTGAVLVSYILDPWGHIRRQNGSSINRHIFTGQEHDENTGLIYFGARYYDPDIARFITQDPYLGDSNTPPSLDRYLYAYSNPTVYVDLLGYDSIDISDKGEVSWVVERDWPGFINPEERRLSIGSVPIMKGFFGLKAQGDVQLTVEFGGGSIPLKNLEKAASRFWERKTSGSVFDPKDISRLPEYIQDQIIQSYIDGTLNPHREARLQAAPPDPTYFEKSSNQLLYGNYTGDVTLLGTAAQVATGFAGIDLPGDIRDITYDMTHWEWSFGHAIQTGVDLVSLLPILGALKYSDEAAALLKRAADVKKQDLMDVVPKVTAPAKRATGVTVLGHMEDYVKLSDELNARRFSIPENIWRKMSDEERWVANKKFLDRTIARGDDIILATTLDRVREGSFFAKELQYLFNKGYRVSADGTRLILSK
jgi:RHS repeat-associated protein